MEIANCIYCERRFNPTKGVGDHVLPSAVFGEFKGDRRFRRCCQKCNNDLGSAEQVISQAAPEGYLRGVILGKSPGRRKDAGIQQKGAKGSKAPMHMVLRDGRYELVRTQAGNLKSVEPVDHFRILDGDGNEHFIRLYPNVKKEQLQKKIDSLGIRVIREVSCNCDESQNEYFKELSKELFSNMTSLEDLPGTEPGIQTLPGRIKFTFSIDYFRAITKIAFHYYLLHNRRGYSGHETQFGPIREFIRFGGDHEQFFDQAGPRFHVPSSEETFVPAEWSHLFWAYEIEKQVQIEMYLFLGPNLVPSPHRIRLSDISSEFIVPDGVWGHRFKYFDQREGRYSGCTETIDIGRLA